ncbi:hypothetical protein ALFP_2881 [Alcaligenes faecalis]|nr:hypothetical protein ALFP_2881 [Alcaligenes faecalis]
MKLPPARQHHHFTASTHHEYTDSFIAWCHAPDQVRGIDDIAYIVCASRYRDLKANNNFIEKKLKVVATTRNFNTVSKLIALSMGNHIEMQSSS